MIFACCSSLVWDRRAVMFQLVTATIHATNPGAPSMILHRSPVFPAPSIDMDPKQQDLSCKGPKMRSPTVWRLPYIPDQIQETADASKTGSAYPNRIPSTRIRGYIEILLFSFVGVFCRLRAM